MKRDDLFMKLTGLYFSFCVVLLHYQPNFGYQNIAVTQLRWMPAFLGYGFLAVNCGAFCKGFKRWALCGLLAVGGVENLISFIGLLCGKKWGFLPEAAMLGHLAALAALFLWVRNCHGQMQTRCGISWVVAILLVVTHRKNIGRLREGTESKIYLWGGPDDDTAKNNNQTK